MIQDAIMDNDIEFVLFNDEKSEVYRRFKVNCEFMLTEVCIEDIIDVKEIIPID